MPIRLRPATVLVLLLVTLAAARGPAAPAQPAEAALGRTLDALVSGTMVDDAHWGISVTDTETGAVLYARNASKNFMPASNAKIFTAAAALSLLGPDYRYETRLYASGPVEGGVLRGNLIVRGSGDPTIGGHDQEAHPTAVFEAWADSLAARGITRVAGDIIGDDDLIDDTPLGRGWAWDDAPYYYSAETGGLVFNMNTIDVRIRGRTPGRPAAVQWTPYNTDYVTIINSTRSLPAGTSIDEEYARERGTNVIHLRSHVPVGRIEREELTVTNPTLYFTHVLRETLMRGGVHVEGQAVDIDEIPLTLDYDEDDGLRVVARYTSPPLTEIARIFVKKSDNLYAEQVLRTLGAERPVEGATEDDDLTPGSAAMGLKAANPFFARAGLDTLRLELVDGSGLSRMNLVTPAAATSLLRHMWSQPEADVRAAFLGALPVGGVDGTLEYRFRSGPARGNVRAKTGTLTGVSALSGYVTTAAGTPLAFSVFANNYTARTSRIRSVQDRIVRALAAYRE